MLAPETINFKIKNLELRVWVALSNEHRRLGLGFCSHLDSDRGMLFPFDKDDFWPVWMKGMSFPIDIIWLDACKTVVDIAHSALPESYPYKFRPSKPARYVLELSDGWAYNNAIVVGTKTVFALPP